LRDTVWKKNRKKGAGGVAQGVDPEFKSQYCQNKKVVDFIFFHLQPKMLTDSYGLGKNLVIRYERLLLPQRRLL
jgi:hypothetical protein